jgi:AbrB family looped-hinge helix DNA binding protein
MSHQSTVKVSRRHQIALPSAARQQLRIRPGDRLIVDIQDGMLILIPKPESFTAFMAGLHKEVWSTINTTTYLQEERSAWEKLKTG